MSHLTATRAAAVAALLAVVAPMIASNALIAFYLTFVALAGMMGATFLAYVRLVDRPTLGPALELAVCALAMTLVMFDAAIRFPTVLDGNAPAIAGSLALAALVVSTLGALGFLVAQLHVDDVRGHLRRPLAR